MRKLLLLLMVIMMAAPSMNAQNKVLQKAIKREYKSKMKEYKKEGWKLFGSSRSLDLVLLKHYEMLESLGEKGYEVVGVCSKYRSDNVGHQSAVTNACHTYARHAGSHVKGRIVNHMASNGEDTSAELDRFYSAYEILVKKEIRGEMQESYAIYRDLGNGEKSMQVFFIVNEESATQARVRAYENAIKESEAVQNYAEKVSGFIQEGFEADK